MKLRNKETGEIFDAIIREKGGSGSYSLIVCNIKAYEQRKSCSLAPGRVVLGEYDSLAELNEEWEDAEDANVLSKEPLIKDEKVRKAIRAWAEAGDIDIVNYYKRRLSYAGGFGSIEFAISDDWDDALESNEVYTIKELCGEEEI